MLSLARFFRSERAKERPVLMADVEAAPLDVEIERQRTILGKQLVAAVAKSAITSSRIRKQVATQVAMQLHIRT